MLSKPTTQQVLLDCRRELLEVIDPAVSDPTVKIAIQMLENVLRNCAERSAHEIAWMRDESNLMVGYARDVKSSVGSTPEIDAALAAYDAGDNTSLDLDAVSDSYSRAGECLSVAIERVFAVGNTELHLRGRDILALRLANEDAIKGEWAFVGRG
ncbi:MAG: hypothetical protein RLZZ128_1300 [Actinomycetota bacterium]|jgi:hypothetical protein|nr:hypothetical protein [Actinomycetota bacterium]NDA76766.1 hypothetical protein [Actinomycetota bacterium]NDD96024.1 hypothetical protein [Actinomycetota bacterium]NDE79395.1 hypothetical protein [Actinomycetota bacterium]NDF30911.1 hypothetical protein [Acidimicrobiia bacterium]